MHLEQWKQYKEGGFGFFLFNSRLVTVSLLQLEEEECASNQAMPSPRLDVASRIFLIVFENRTTLYCCQIGSSVAARC